MQKIDYAIYLLRQQMPYLSHGISAMELIKKDLPEHIPIGVDKYWRCYYDEKQIESFKDTEVAWLLAHELAHLVRKHWKRCGLGTEEHPRWNVAADLEINDDMHLGTNLEPLEDGCFPKQFGYKEGLLAEEYFILLENKVVKVKVPGGSCSDGNHREWEDNVDGNCMSEEEGNIITEKIAQSIDKHPGNVPGGWKIWAKKLLKPKVNWEAELKHLILNTIAWVKGHVYPSYAYPPRRRHPNFILPGKISPNPRICTIIDTSGSMYDVDQKLLGQCLAEVGEILRMCPSHSIKCVCGDTQGHFAKKVFNTNQIELKGGGGTNMGHIILENEKDTDIIVVLTDGYTPWCHEIKKKVIACVFSDEIVPAWIRTVRVVPN